LAEQKLTALSPSHQRLNARRTRILSWHDRAAVEICVLSLSDSLSGALKSLLEEFLHRNRQTSLVFPFHVKHIEIQEMPTK
jgi:hypothetical protein